METKYPRFIQSNPCGIDKFEGQSQRRLTNAIANHITSIDKIENNIFPRIIGLEGSWGVGKSNVIKQLENHEKIKDNYFLFEYDAWGHQEDLQRRSFLELLTTELIEVGILEGRTTIKIKGGGEEKVSWQEKLKYLLAKKTETKTEQYPRISNSVLVSGLVIILTSLFMFFASIAKNFITLNWLSISISIILPLLPILVTLIIWWRACKKDIRYKKLDYLLAIYNNDIKNDICYETINEDEPTVTEFKTWMQDISEHIKNNKKQNLIVVFDNMDRLPAEKVKQLWSSIHTFFSEKVFENIWTIIPFDEKHLACAFGESDNINERELLTKYFISKTFPVVYSVTPPTITDFNNLFNKLFEEAFANTETDRQEDISRIFRLEKPNTTVREVIEFINQLVALKNIWQGDIDILYIAIFILKKSELQKSNIAEEILSGDYLGKYILSIVSNDEVLQKNISALIYGVPCDIAEQIPISKYLDSCLVLEDDINKFANSSIFIQALSDKIQTANIGQTDNIIKCLSHLDTTKFSESNKKNISLLWNTIAKRKMEIPLNRQEIDENYKLLLFNVDDNYKQKVIEYLCEQIQSFETENEITEYLNKIVVEKLSKEPIDTLYQQRADLNNYWFIIIKNLIDTNFLKDLPDNLTELGRKLLDDIAKGIPNSNNDLFKKLIDKLDKRKIIETIVQIRNQICNNVQDYAMSKNKFLFLHSLFEEYGNLLSRAEDVTQYILIPIANDDECLNKIIDHSELYIKIISNANNQAYYFNKIIESKIKNSSDTNLISFTKKSCLYPENRQILEAIEQKELQQCRDEIKRQEIMEKIRENPNYYSLHEIKMCLDNGIISKEEFLLNCDIPVHIIDSIEHFNSPYLKFGKTPYLIPDDSCTEVYFWGLPRSGKTCALAAILNTANKNGYFKFNGGYNFEYGINLNNIFRDDIGFLPSATYIDNIQYFPFELIKNNKSYKVATIDMSGQILQCLYYISIGTEFPNELHKNTFDSLDRLLKNKNRKIHFFFIDYEREEFGSDFLTQQDVLTNALFYFRHNAIFGKSRDAIYVVLTKSDLLLDEQGNHVNGYDRRIEYAKKYLNDNYASFSHLLKDYCKEYSINDGKLLFIPFSLGKVYFQQICRFDDTDAQKILDILFEIARPKRKGIFDMMFK